MVEAYSEKDQVLLVEARRCRDAEAFRAAFIITWIAVAEGLRWRFNDMALRDSQMAKWIEETDRQEASSKAIDQRLLDKARTTGLISEPEFKKLNYLKEMRHSYAHPTGVGPSGPEVDAAIDVAIETVLSRPPLLGYGYARELVDAMFADPHFLDDVEEKVVNYVDQLVLLLQPDVVPWFVGQLIERLSAVLADPQLTIFTRRALWLARRVLSNAQNINSPQWKIEKMLGDQQIAAALTLGHISIFGKLSDRAQDMAFGWLAEPTILGNILPPSAPAMDLLVALSDAEELDERQQERMKEAIARVPYTTTQQSVPFRFWAGKIIDDLGVHNWYVQNPAVAALNEAGRVEVAACSEDVQEELGRRVLAAADGTAAEAEAFLRRMVQSDGQRWPAALVRGLLLEAIVHEGGRLRIKPTWLPVVLQIVSQHPDNEEIVKYVTSAIEQADVDRQAELTVGLEDLDEVSVTEGADILEAVRSATRALLESGNATTD